MVVMRFIAAIGGLLALAATPAWGVEGRRAGEAEPPALRTTPRALADLRQGGMVIVLTHGPAATDEEDLDVAPGGCASQRGLTDTGRLMASGIGRFLARQGVRVGVVLSSRYCRAVETADRIAQNTHASKVRRVDELGDAAKAPPAERARRSSALKRIAATPPAAGTNTIAVTHGTNVGDAFGPVTAPVGDGELFVVRPLRGADGRSSYRVVHRLRVEDLSAYAKAAKS